MQRLKAYCRRTMLEAAREYAHPKKRRTAESTLAAFKDHLNGTATGTWHELIYTVDVLALFNRYRSDVRAAIADYMGETGARMSDPVMRDGETAFADLIAATARRQTPEHYNADGPRGEVSEAACLAIRFAVEYLAGDVARDICPEL